MTMSVGLGRSHNFFVFALDPDLSATLELQDAGSASAEDLDDVPGHDDESHRPDLGGALDV